MSVGLYAAALLLVALAVGPAVWLVNVSLQPAGVGINELTPVREMTGANYVGAWRDGNLWRPVLASVAVTVVQAFLNVVLAALAAYPLARMRFVGRDVVFVVVLVTLMIPEQVVMIPLFVLVAKMGLYDTLAAVVVPFAVSGFGIYLCRQAFMAIPREIEEAAEMDGAGSLAVWWHVMLPLARPTLATLGVFSVIGAWSNLLWPVMVLQSDSNMTLPVAVNQLLGVFATNIRYAYAGSVMALVPMVVVYLFAQRYLERGMMAGAVKG
jgi:putative chitobiose transport system permease protein